ncbi:MAG: hypothetical protein A2W91_02650 [Bacteroidetes bacterium GWF2_38_335]|nr:MAG: hypothetical protein A2W91_02650 [Bacteroidetes bacterium GWF2_38_335]OFY77606.1 MAG: hypothetical protein A2281_02110 [Bacteroidetes bacterium RIFOXYA12_FULL_38_20]
MKKYSLKIIMLLTSFGILILSSCEKVIDVNLNSSDPKLVIEAKMTDSANCQVKLSETVNFDETNTFPEISGAVITLRDNYGNFETLTETSAGIYSSFSIIGIPGNTYTLKVTVDEKTYTAISSMPYPVAIDTITFTSIGALSHKTNMASVELLDPMGIKNYYRFVEIINGQTQNNIFIFEDRFDDGKSITAPLFTDPGSGDASNKILSGDAVEIMAQCIDKSVYDYFLSLSQSGGGMHSSTPANPKSNFSNGALGYFSAYSSKSKTVVVP